ncbi:Galactoside transport system permease protein mglC [Anaerobiospirillum thomasii]|uniref:Galactoside transport system permease protein mglC n=1 Tax=Anaerobiospirillum thomasii TaxID=179995 RepID=A0A2X0V676_9GAMM|nr:beta-methylgalactoside transporter permease [Anaerobiospirillum thomasii]SPT68245.1 Galactoside transport system permease protein mglC [Anaerobiospirillum thomasii]SPT70714.1 Galactoside transport system permease protein mglC [Anaerobiospirillum thomasii]
MSTVITQSSYRKSLTGLGLGILLLGVALFFAKIKVIYDLPVLMMIIGAWVAIQNGMRLYKPGHNIQDIEINAKTLNNVLTNYAIIIAMVVLVLIICILQPRFMQIRVVLDIMTQSSTKLIIALGICFTLIIAGCDLSAGRIVGLAAVISTSMLQTEDYANRFFPELAQLPLFVPIITAVVVCMIFGALNGFLVAQYEMHPFIATLATSVIVYGTCSLYFDLPPNNSQPIGGVRPDFAALGQTKLFQFGRFPGVSVLIPIAAVITVIIWFVLNKTIFGKNVYALGGNREAAVVAGVNVYATNLFIFILAAGLYGIAGVLEAARTAGATNQYGMGYELDAIAACVVGGVSLMGGIATVSGIIAGVFVFTIIQYGLQFISVSPMWQQVIKGIIIATAVAIDMGKYRKKV